MAIFNVESGASPWSIATAVFGDGRRYQEIIDYYAEVNNLDPARYGTGWSIPSGVIQVPDESEYGVRQELYFASVEGREPAGWALESASQYGVNPADFAAAGA